MKILLGLTGIDSVQSRNVRRSLVDSLNVLHVNIKQPVIDMVAMLLRISAHEFEHHFDKNVTLKKFNAPASSIFAKVEAAVCSGNKNALIEEALTAMERHDAIADMMAGTLISGINTDDEAHWLRHRGGQIIHIIDQDTPQLACITHHPSDFTIYINRNVKSDENLLLQMLVNSKKPMGHGHAATNQ